MSVLKEEDNNNLKNNTSRKEQEGLTL